MPNLTRIVDWIGFELLSELCLGHVAFGAGLGIIYALLANISDGALFVVAALLLIAGIFGMLGHYIYRYRLGGSNG
jgi:hypothetical protein